jgi:hypothetical protein
MTAYREEAVEVVEHFRDLAVAHLERTRIARKQRREDLASVAVEKWIGTPTHGRWKCLSRQAGGFIYAFAAPASNGRRLPKSGDRVECVLLAEKTRKGGWKAKLVERNLVGPVTNTAEVPGSAAAGQRVCLRVGAISAGGQRIQFDWLPDAER